MEGLTTLLSPYSTDTFFTKYWGQQALKISASDRDYFNYLFSWDELTRLLNFHEKHFPLFRLASDKNVLSPAENDNFLQRCREGATLIIDHVHKKVPAIAELVSAVQYDLGLGHRTQVNAYCSWPGVQGFDCHYDTHEVFILQVEGNKEWFVFEDTLGHPLANRHINDASPPETEPYIHTTLEPGDVLYIPRGHWHYALAKDQPSIHLTLGVHCHTGVDLLDWLKNQLQQEEDWRQNLPTNITDLHSHTMENYVNDLVNKLQQLLKKDNLSSEYTDHLASKQTVLCSYSFPYQVGFRLEEVDQNTFLRWPRYQRAFVSTDGGQYNIRMGSKEIKLKGIPQSFIDNLFAYPEFSAYQAWEWLSDYDWDADVQPLLSRLVMEGLLLVKPSQTETMSSTNSKSLPIYN